MIDLTEIENLTKKEEPLKIDFQQLHDIHFVDLSEDLKPQPIAISIGTNNKGYPITFGSYGDFSTIAGLSKAKKSFLKSMITAGYIGGNANLFTQFRGHQQSGKYVIDIDTEQSKYHSQRAFRRVMDMVGNNYEYYKPFSLRKLSPNDRLGFVDWIFTKSDYKNNIGLMLIDGIADLINDVNSVEESTMLVQKLMTWTDISQCHIITNIHLNPGTEKPKGHLGSFILQKAETIARVKKETDLISSVYADYARNQAFEDFQFMLTDDGLPKQIGFDEFKAEVNKDYQDFEVPF